MINIDPNKDKRMDRISSLEYLDGHQNLIFRFMEERVRSEDRSFRITTFMEKHPEIFAQVVMDNYETSDEERLKMVLEKITAPGKITIVLGAKGKGKTALVIWVAEESHEKLKKKIMWFGYSPAIKRHYPSFIQTVDLIGEEDSVLLYDEVLLTMYARDSSRSESKNRIKMLPTLRHRGMAIIFLTQSEGFDVEILRQADYLIFKPFPAFSMELFREKMGSNYRLNPVIQFVLPVHNWDNLLYDLHENKVYFFQNPLPKKWNDDLSKPYSLLKTPEDYFEYTEMLENAGYSEREIETLCTVRGVDRLTQKEWKGQ